MGNEVAKRKRGQQPYDPEPNRELVRTLATRGLARLSIASQVGISESTLYAHHLDDLKLGDADNESLHIGNINHISQNRSNAHVALRASQWVLERRHGYGETVNVNVGQDQKEVEEQREAELQSLDEKLQPYLKVNNRVDFDQWAAHLSLAQIDHSFRGDIDAFRALLDTIEIEPVTIEGEASQPPE
ncbi:hypothetical protein [Shimia thalassica]|uniref:hypothetical protein n=1 Tax=Shimia thalassica TaxID=1715693 RepID=UPI0026E3AF4A|nr:hypothetical protein [Shimia thalassica]MDO6479125.1 hypothetical protein [Shimia thalassica]